MIVMFHQIRRSFHTTCLFMTKKNLMPGMHHQLAALENAADLTDNPEDLENMEADFMKVNQTHRQHEAELKAERDRVRHLIVKKKYFHEPRMPNFLLYAEKEEIRRLHAHDPEQWTIERLAESFPATKEIIKKILDSNWRANSIKRIRTHDQAAVRNWELLRDNNTEDLYLTKELREHLSKFGNRTIDHIPTIKYKATLFPKLPKPKRNEFSSIITSCKKYAENEPKKKHSQTEEKIIEKNPFMGNVRDPEKETFLLAEVQDKRRMRLEDWQKENMTEFKQLENREQPTTTKEPSSNEESTIIVPPLNPSGTGYIKKFESNEIVVSAEDSKRYEMSNIKERVHIPRKLWRKGYTYRVEDCYYDDDGEFLYRVPGMSGKPQTESKENGSNEGR